MPHLYMFSLGGNAGKSNIEVHDIQFVVADSVEAALPLLREAWFGDADKIHLDGYQKVQWVAGYDVRLSTEPVQAAEKLYFVNVGGYSPDTLAELHDFALFVATSADDAKKQALRSLLVGVAQQHKDNLKEVDNQLLLDRLQGYYVHLVKNPQGKPDRPEWQGYRPIGITAA
jgi:hypothetical protein